MSDLDEPLGLEPDDLDGHTIAELDDYLDRGRRPADPSIDNSPACQIALGALQRLRQAASALVARRPDEPAGEEDWIAGVIATLSLEAHAGRRFPLPLADARIEAVITEGALRGLVRAVGDEVPGVLIGSVRIDTDDPPTVAVITVEVAVAYGYPIPTAADRLRAALDGALPAHLPFAVERIDLHVVGVLDLREGASER